MKVVSAWIAAQSGWRAALLCFAAGAFAALAHAPFHIVPAFIAAIVVFVWQLDGASAAPRPRRAAAMRAWCFASGQFLPGLYWVGAAFNVDSSTYGPLWGVPATLALALGLALFWALAAALAIGFWRSGWRRVAWFALVFGAAEYARGTWFTGFPWNLPAYIWQAGEPISQFAAIGGAYGLSLLTLALAAAPATLSDRASGALARLAPVLITALAFGLVWGAGVHNLARPLASDPAAPIVRVADAGVSQRDKWERRPDQEWRMLARYIAVSGDAADSRAAVLIWPEGALPAVNTFLLEDPALQNAIGRFLGDRALVLGFSRREAAPGGVAHYFNSAGIIDGVAGRARIAQIYDKHHLVPFGEYIPFWSMFSGLNIAPLQQIGAGFTPGAPPSRVIIPEAPPAIILICYEAIFPGMTPRGADRPGWIINVTNDAWYGRGTGPWQHFNQARYRAIEEGLPLARAASGGVSAIVDPFGRTVMATGLDGGAAEARLPTALPPTIYARWGQFIVPLLFGLLLILSLAPRRARPRGE